jgi:predicted  nucleic acid-binding Zn-ribbon protein
MGLAGLAGAEGTTLNDDIRRLVRLQELAFQMRELEQVQETLPDRIAVLDRDFETRMEEIGAARLRHEALTQQQVRLNQERDELQDRLRVAQQKLMHVNNQREYSAVLNEIDTLKAALATVEDSLLDGDVQLEQLAGPVAEADVRIDEERQRTASAKREIGARMAESGERLAQLRALREDLCRELPGDVLRRFDGLFRVRGGIAVARVDKDSCAACHVRLRPQVLNLARRGEELVTCESCRRILYVDDSDEAVAPESSAVPAPDVHRGTAAAE